MRLKPRPNRRRYIEVLRSMSPDERAQKAFELSAFTKQLFWDGLRNRYPNVAQAELRQLALKRLSRCHNRNF